MGDTVSRIVSEAHTAEDIARLRTDLMSWRDLVIAPGYAEPGSDQWCHRVVAAELEAAISLRAVELGLETHD